MIPFYGGMNFVWFEGIIGINMLQTIDCHSDLELTRVLLAHNHVLI